MSCTDNIAAPIRNHQWLPNTYVRQGRKGGWNSRKLEIWWERKALNQGLKFLSKLGNVVVIDGKAAEVRGKISRQLKRKSE